MFTGLPQNTDLQDSPTSTLCTASTMCRGPVDRTKTNTGNVCRVREENATVELCSKMLSDADVLGQHRTTSGVTDECHEQTLTYCEAYVPFHLLCSSRVSALTGHRLLSQIKGCCMAGQPAWFFCLLASWWMATMVNVELFFPADCCLLDVVHIIINVQNISLYTC